jgi:hypothetical protein
MFPVLYLAFALGTNEPPVVNEPPSVANDCRCGADCKCSPVCLCGKTAKLYPVGDPPAVRPAADTPDDKVVCPHCLGVGYHVNRMGVRFQCPVCAGTGKVDKPKATASAFTAPPGFSLVPLAGNGCAGGFAAGAGCAGGFGGPQRFAGGCAGGFGSGAAAGGCAGGSGGGARPGLFAGHKARVEYRVAKRAERHSGGGNASLSEGVAVCDSGVSFAPPQQFAYAPQETSFVGSQFSSTPTYYASAPTCRMINGRMVCN